MQPHCLKTIYADISSSMLLAILHFYYLYPVHFDFLLLAFFLLLSQKEGRECRKRKKSNQLDQTTCLILNTFSLATINFRKLLALPFCLYTLYRLTSLNSLLSCLCFHNSSLKSNVMFTGLRKSFMCITDMIYLTFCFISKHYL